MNTGRVKQTGLEIKQIVRFRSRGLSGNAPGIFIFIAAVILTCACGKSREGSSNLTDLDRLYITHRPPVGKVHLIDVTGETYGRKLLAISLQGVVNRSEARIYMVDGDTGGSRPWEKLNDREAAMALLDLYRRDYGVELAWEGRLDEALKLFAGEAAGYHLANESEPWTINAGTTLSGMTRGLVVLGADSGTLDSLGVKKLSTLSGVWRNASECYIDLERNYYPKMANRGIAIINPEEHRLRDFLTAQGIMAVFAVPNMDDWSTIQGIFRRMPLGTPIFGYIAQTPEEEVVAVISLSEAGKFLIPTDTTSNISFHSTVVPNSMGRSRRPDESAEGACSRENVNVCIAISDGDNLIIPLSRYQWPSNWRSASRGKIRFGWSFSLALPTLAPAVADSYIRGATANDELVGMLGIGYTHYTYMPNRDWFLGMSFSRMRDLGLWTYWTLDPALYKYDSTGWDVITENSVDGRPSGALLGYFSFSGKKVFKTAGNLPVLVAVNSYDDTPGMLKDRIRELMAMPASERPLITFLSASVWSNNLEDIVETLAPLEAEGVKFMLPSDALKCAR
jgi:hypothetical protein